MTALRPGLIAAALAASATPDYFDVLKTSANTASGNPKDKFHFTYPTAHRSCC